MTPLPAANLRILVIDDNRSIHQDFKKILGRGPRTEHGATSAESLLFGEATGGTGTLEFELTFAEQGQQGLLEAERAEREGRPFAVAFVDVRMPPGWDGLETIERIWKTCPDLEVVVCTAYSDYSWDQMIQKLGYSDRLLILKKPFDNIEVVQLATALTEKWQLRQMAKRYATELERGVNERTADLAAAHAFLEKTNQSLRRAIAQRHEAEGAAVAWQQRFDVVASSSRQAMYDRDRESGAIAWNGAVVQVLGCSAAALPEAPEEWMSLIHPDDRVEAEHARALAEESASPLVQVYRLKCGDDYRWVQDRSTVIILESDGHSHRLGVIEDISVRRQAEQRIQEQASLLDETQDAMFVCDLDYCLSYWNRGAERLYGWTAAEANRQKAPDLLHFLAPLAFQEASRVALAEGAWSGELQQETQHGSTIKVESRWTVLRDHAGTPVSFLVVNTDVTGRRDLETRFLRAQRLESIGLLASGIAHDLNNVFTPIMMAGQLLKERYDARQTDPMFGVLHASAVRGAAMVRQVLTFARGADGERTDLTLEPLLAEIEALVHDTFSRSLVLQTAFDASLHHVHANSSQLHQVLMNVFVNARDAMPDGGTLTFEAHNVMIDEAFARIQPNARPGPYVRISLRDSGTGMSPEVLDRVFEPFFTTKDPDKGTGLGLSTSLGIVRSHGGFWDVESAPGKGTEMRIYLPAYQPIQAAALSPESCDAPNGGGELILVVDDEASIRDITRLALELHGYQVQVAADGNQAVELFSARPEQFKLVITDLMMPAMDGPATIAALRQLAPFIPIIAVSGVTGNKKYEQVANSKGISFLPKPYSVSRLLAAVSATLIPRDTVDAILPERAAIS